MSFAKQVAITVGANGGLAVLNFASGTMAARLLGPTGRGELAAIQTWATFLATVATLGLTEAVVLFCAREPNRAGRYVSSAVVLGLIGCAPMLVLSYLLMPYLLSAQAPPIVYAARWYLGLAVAYVIIGGPYGALRSLRDLTAWNAIRFIPGILWISILCFAWSAGNKNPAFLALLNLLAYAAIAVPITFWVVRRKVKGSYRIDTRSWRPMLRFGLPSVSSTIPQSLNLRLDQMLMAALLPARLLGLYVVAVAWSGMMSPLLLGVAAVLFPHIASHQSKEERSRAFVRVVGLASPIALVSAIALAIVTPWTLTIVFGHSYRESIPSAIVLVMAGAVLSIDQLLEEGFRGFNKPISILYSELGGLVITAISLLLLLKPVGIMGAAISSLLGYTTVGILLLIQARSETGSPIRSMLVPSRSEVRMGWARLRRLSWTS